MSYLEKEKLIKADIASIENKVRHAFNQGYDLGFKDGKERAKPLEQEPILDNLRAEITTLQNRCYALTKGAMCAFCRYECEYKAEPEET